MKNIRVLIVPVSIVGREMLEGNIEGRSFTLSEIAKECEGVECQVLSLSDFVDLCNNEELELGDVWISYFQLKDETSDETSLSAEVSR